MVVSTKGVGGVNNNVMRGALKAKGHPAARGQELAVRQGVAAIRRWTRRRSCSAGPCAIAYGGDSIVDVAKELHRLDQESSRPWRSRAPSWTAALFDGQGADAAVQDADPSGAAGHGSSAAFCRPARRLAGALKGPAGVIAGCLKTIIEKAEKQAA